MLSFRTFISRSLALTALGGVCAAPAASQTASFAIKIGFDVVTDCERPFYTRQLPVHADFEGFLNPDGKSSANLTYSIPLTSTVHFEPILNGGPAPSPGGASSLRTIGRDHYQMVWDLPTNLFVLEVSKRPGSCTATVAIRLKPQAREYTIYVGPMNYCSRIIVKKVSCETN